MGQKKSFTASTGEILNGARTPEPKGKGETPQEKRPVGRPRIHKHRTTSTSQEGLRPGLTRMTFIVSEENQEKLKYISYFEKMTIRQILDEAIDDYIAKYESEAGPIQLN